MNSIVVRFPDGSKEFRFPDKMLEQGDVIWHAGEAFRVVNVTMDDGERPVVSVERDAGLGDTLRSEEGAVRLTPFDA